MIIACTLYLSSDATRDTAEFWNSSPPLTDGLPPQVADDVAMATVQPRLQAHTRTRSGQIPANTARPLQHQNNQPTSAPSHNGIPPAKQPLAIFVTNLKLLDLDLLPDWPGISPEIFALGPAASQVQSQKKRIHCVEWALFQLFALWDPEETANKLKPYFPPLDQVQSLNLRAALLRALDKAKKNGILGRDAVLRKTMLDECRGDKLEDVLAAFSTAVLKKYAMDDATAHGRHPSIALSLAHQARGYKDDKTDLTALILAHKVSLRRIQGMKAGNGTRFRDFADLLGIKERGIVRRDEEANQRDTDGNSAPVDDGETLAMWRTVRNNWSGNERWMETLVYGDSNSGKDGLVGMPFDRVWRRVEQDRLGELEAKDSGLLEQLDSRVRQCQQRLEKWQSYRQNMSRGQGGPNPSSPSKPKAPYRQKGIDFGFGAHQDLRLGAAGPMKTTTRNVEASSHLNSDYRGLLDGLENELAGDDASSDPLGFLHVRPRTNRRSSGTERASGGDISELSELDDEVHEPEPSEPITSPFQNNREATRRLPVRPMLNPPNTAPTEVSTPPSASAARGPMHAYESPERSSQLPASPADVTPPQSESMIQRIPGDDIPLSPTRKTTDQVLESMDGASPSPTKRTKPRHTLSLQERTRLSMAPRGSLHLLEEDADMEPETTKAATTFTKPDANITMDDDEPEDLVARTRRSMAGFDKAKQKAQLERRRSKRMSKMLPPPRKEGSYFPVVDENTEEQSTFTEELLGEEDMEAVFRSRPKIKASPLPSPTREDFGY